MKKSNKILAVAGAAVAMVAVLAGCTSHYTEPSMIALRYSGGISEGGKFVECVEPGEKQVSNDTYYNYPTTQREDVWDSDRFDPENPSAGTNSADQGDLQVTDKGGNMAYLKVKVTFVLNSDCDVLQDFHNKIGKTRVAYFDDEGSYGDGWIWAMNNYIGTATEETARNASVNYTVEELWLDPSVRQSLAADIQEKIQKAVDDRTEGDNQFYKIGTVSIYNASPAEEFQDLYEERKNAQVRAETAEANKAAQVAEAQAKTEVAREEAKARAAEIEGWGGADAYLKKLAIDEGMNPYQPNYGEKPTVTTESK